MRKKILVVVLVFVMLLGIMPAYAENNITVYLAMSRYGDVILDKDGNDMAYVSVDLSGKDSYIIDDAFLKAHEMYYEDGIDGYASSEGEFGFGIDKLWGDTSYNFGYWVNGTMAMGVGDTVEDGDFIDAFIYKNIETEAYSMFDKRKAETEVGDVFELTLTYVSGYDDNWNCIFSPCEDATIMINGEESEYKTDEDGKAYIEFDKPGIKILSAKKEIIVKDKPEPVITAPVCVVDVISNPTLEIIHNLAKKYAQINLEDALGNLPWIVADLMTYEDVFGENVTSDEMEKKALSLIVESVVNSEKPGDMAKAILAIRSLGYDARNIITGDYDKLDIVKNLTDLVDSGDESVTNIYTLPYVIIALSQHEEYATDEQMEYLINSAITSKDSWQITEYGTDAMTPMVQALSKFYTESEDVKQVVDETLEIIKAEQRTDGLIDGFEGYESASTALAICAFSSLGINPDSIKNGEISLIDGLMSTANSDHDSFPNAFADEQGLRGLLAWQMLIKNTDKVIYDFSEYPIKRANIPGVKKCPVVFKVTPSTAEVTIDGALKLSKNCFDLAGGNYDYKVTASGYNTRTGNFNVGDDEEDNNIKKVIKITLDSVSSGGGGGGSASVKKEEEDDENTTAEEEKTEVKKEFSENTFSDVDPGDWYYSAVKFAYENNLFAGTENGFEPDTPMTRAMIVTVLYRLSESNEIIAENPFADIQDDKWYAGSIKWAAANNIVSGVTDTEFLPDSNLTREQLAAIIYRYAKKFGYDIGVGDIIDLDTYTDSENISSYATDAVKYVIGAGVMTGRNYDSFCPGEMATRAEVASMLMRFAGIGER